MDPAPPWPPQPDHTPPIARRTTALTPLGRPPDPITPAHAHRMSRSSPQSLHSPALHPPMRSAPMPRPAARSLPPARPRATHIISRTRPTAMPTTHRVTLACRLASARTATQAYDPHTRRHSLSDLTSSRADTSAPSDTSRSAFGMSPAFAAARRAVSRNCGPLSGHKCTCMKNSHSRDCPCSGMR